MLQTAHCPARREGGRATGESASAGRASRSPRLAASIGNRALAAGFSRGAGDALRNLSALGNHQAAARLAGSLRLGDPAEAAERQADRAADVVMRMPHPGPAPAVRSRGTPVSPPLPRPHAVPGAVQAALRSPGRPLDSGLRSFFEPRFGSDFGDVRVHTGGLAATAARTVNATAFTAGNHIVFDAGEYRANTQQGRHLIAHELAHIVQQRGSRTGRIMRDGRRHGRPAVPITSARDTVRWLAQAIEIATADGASARDRARAVDIIVEVERWVARLATPAARDRAHRVSGYSVRSSIPTLHARLLSAPRQISRHIRLGLRRESGTWAYWMTSFQAGLGLLEFYNDERSEPLPTPHFDNAERNTSAFVSGLGRGLQEANRRDVARRLAARFGAAAALSTILPIILASGLVVGALGDIWASLRDLVRFLMNPRDVFESLARFLSSFFGRNEETFGQLGREVGRSLAAEVGELSNQDPVTFTFNLGRILGPLVTEAVLALVSAGVGLLLRGVARALGLARILRRLAPILRIVRRASHGLRRLVRRARRQIRQNIRRMRRRGNRHYVPVGRHTYRRDHRGRWCRITNPALCFTDEELNAELDRAFFDAVLEMRARGTPYTSPVAGELLTIHLLERGRVPQFHRRGLRSFIQGQNRSNQGMDVWGFGERRAPSPAPPATVPPAGPLNPLESRRLTREALSQGPVGIEVKTSPSGRHQRLPERDYGIQQSPEGATHQWLEALRNENRAHLEEMVDEGRLHPHWLDAEWVARHGPDYFSQPGNRFFVVISPGGVAGLARRGMDTIEATLEVVQLAAPPGFFP